MNARDELARIIASQHTAAAVEAILAAGYQRPRDIGTAEELDTLPVGSVVLSDPYRHHSHGFPVAFQRWEDGLWHRGGRSSDTHPDYILPAAVLHEPESSCVTG